MVQQHYQDTDHFMKRGLPVIGRFNCLLILIMTDTDHFIRRFNCLLILIMTQIQITSFIIQFNCPQILIMTQIQITPSDGSTASWSSLWHRSLHQTVQLPPDPHYDTDTDNFIRRFNCPLILIMTQIRSLHQMVQLPPDTHYDTDTDHSLINSS